MTELELKLQLENGFEIELSSECGNVFEARKQSGFAGKFLLRKNGELIKSETSFNRIMGSLALGSLTVTDII
tara:strand:- start:731 stop:946 length:216 start_codon:yes stop_codon:yes gene_type:complete